VQKDDLKVTNAMLPFTVGVKLLHTWTSKSRDFLRNSKRVLYGTLRWEN
jgi:hypothetical protein